MKPGKAQLGLPVSPQPTGRAADLFQPAGSAEEVVATGAPRSDRALATLEHLAGRYGGYVQGGADYFVRDPIGQSTEVWRFHPESKTWLELVEVRRDVNETPEEQELLRVEVRAA